MMSQFVFEPIRVLHPLDWIALCTFLISYFGYHRLIDRMASSTDVKTRQALFEDLIESVSENAMTEEGKDLLAVEFRAHARTLIFLGTLSFFALSGAISLFVSSNQIQNFLSFSLFERVQSSTGVRLRLLIVILLAGYALLQIIWGLKALYSLSLSIHSNDQDTIKRYLRHLNIDFLRSIRTFYYLAVLILWLFGAEFLIVGSVLLTLVLYRYDFLKRNYD
ncbi:MAG: DUF599 family protein [bacterium]